VLTHFSFCVTALQFFPVQIQFGAFSPMFRMHCTKDSSNYRCVAHKSAAQHTTGLSNAARIATRCLVTLAYLRAESLLSPLPCAGMFSLIWLFPDAYYKIMRKFTRLRAALVPYLADAALNTYDSGLGLMLPLYYNCQSYAWRICLALAAHAPAVLQLSMIGRRGMGVRGVFLYFWSPATG